MIHHEEHEGTRRKEAMKTQEEIDQQIKSLEELKSKVVPRTAFGDDNVAAVEAQIKALREDFDEDDCYEEWPDVEDDEDGSLTEVNRRLRDQAREAVAWRNGESDQADLCDDWPLKNSQ